MIYAEEKTAIISKALTDPIYYKEKGGTIFTNGAFTGKIVKLEKNDHQERIFDEFIDTIITYYVAPGILRPEQHFRLKEYGITWSLNRKDLELDW